MLTSHKDCMSSYHHSGNRNRMSILQLNSTHQLRSKAAVLADIRKVTKRPFYTPPSWQVGYQRIEKPRGRNRVGVCAGWNTIYVTYCMKLDANMNAHYHQFKRLAVTRRRCCNQTRWPKYLPNCLNMILKYVDELASSLSTQWWLHIHEILCPQTDPRQF